MAFSVSFSSIFETLKNNRILLGVFLFIVVGLIGRYIYAGFVGTKTCSNNTDGCCDGEASCQRQQHTNDTTPLETQEQGQRQEAYDDMR